MPEVKRQTAYKCSIKQILEGNYVQRPGWEPNYVTIKGDQVSRVNVISAIIEKNNSSFTVDDGTGQVQIMIFNEAVKIDRFTVGDVVLIIGKVREYNSKRFIVPEIMRLVDSNKWVEYRKKELLLDSPVFEEAVKESKPKAVFEVEKFEGETVEDNYAAIILKTIKKLDLGEGAVVEDVVRACGLAKAEKYIGALINEGEIYEVRGKLRIL